MVKTIDTTTTDRLRRSPLYLDLSPSCARKRACMELTTICRFQRPLNPSFRLFQCFRSITSLPGLFFHRRRTVFILLAMPPPSLGRAALVMWCGRFKPRLEIRHTTALTTGAKHWHRQKAVFYVFCFSPSIFPRNQKTPNTQKAKKRERGNSVPLSHIEAFSLKPESVIRI